MWPSFPLWISRSEFPLLPVWLWKFHYGLITLVGRYYDGDALAVAKVVTELASFGIEARHLRSFKSASDREIGLIEQVITPLTRQKSIEAKARAEEVQRELASLSVKLHASLVRSGLNRLR